MIRAMLGAAAVCCASLVSGAALAATPPDQVDESFLAHAKVLLEARAPDFKGFGPQVANVDSLVNFTGSFVARGLDGNGNFNRHWPWAMVGNSPAAGGTTRIDAPIFPVSVRLLDENGHQRYVNGERLFLPADHLVETLLDSPIFSNSLYSSSSEPTQFTDALMRAEFWSRGMAQDWHTLLVPHVKEEHVISVPKGLYRFALNHDGSCCRFILIDINEFLNLLFPPTFPFDNSTVIGDAELEGDMTTKTIATLLFGDVYLYFGDPSVPGNCCVLGFHTFDFEPGVPENGNVQRAYVMNYSSWSSPGLFGNAFVDATAVSHEMSELFNDPLVGAFSISGGACGAPGQPTCLDTTPWWLAPNGNCQNNLETGDVIEGLPNATIPITTHGFTYHPQNEALLQWFEFRDDSDALGGAFSFPDPSVLTGPSVPQQVGCTGPLHLDD
jgi:hypothetical protein